MIAGPCTIRGLRFDEIRLTSVPKKKAPSAHFLHALVARPPIRADFGWFFPSDRSIEVENSVPSFLPSDKALGEF